MSILVQKTPNQTSGLLKSIRQGEAPNATILLSVNPWFKIRYRPSSGRAVARALLF